MEIKKDRGQGTTTRQLQQIEQNGLFVWCNSHLKYPRDLARRLGREDINIVSPNMLSMNEFRGKKYSEVIVDHAAQLNTEQCIEVNRLRRYGR